MSEHFYTLEEHDFEDMGRMATIKNECNVELDSGSHSELGGPVALWFLSTGNDSSRTCPTHRSSEQRPKQSLENGLLTNRCLQLFLPLFQTTGTQAG